MDNQKFGAFIASVRKEKGWTQLELAEKLNVTDKAVSKWERGVGFPDIKMIEPLAEALGVSVLEIMRSERMDESQVFDAHASEALSNVIDVVACQRRTERRNILICVSIAAAFIMGIFLVDIMQPEGILFVCIPRLFLIIGLCLLIMSWRRHRQRQTYGTTLIIGITALIIPVLFFLLLIFAFVLGGPVPN